MSDVRPAVRRLMATSHRLSARLYRLRAAGRRLASAVRQVAGMPDYERYLAHRARHHPGEPVLTRERFVAQSIDRKFGKAGARCC